MHSPQRLPPYETLQPLNTQSKLRSASDRFAERPRCRSRVKYSGTVYSGPEMIRRYSRPRHLIAGWTKPRLDCATNPSGFTTIPSPPG